jgi:ectoine hydroxylase-related dioxygenase (phytanoyl-CoA dioxygenase family)
MKHELSDEQIAFFRDNGFLIVEGFLNAAELEYWRKTTEEAVAKRLGSDTLNNQKDPDAFYAQVFTQALRLADIHNGMRDLVYDRRIGKMAATLVGEEGMRVWHDQALFKPPLGNPTAWHLDNPYWSFSSRHALSFWIALDDATLENGCMWYIPGSHNSATYENVGIGQNMADLFKVYPAWRQVDPVCGACPAGSVVWHNGLTAHGAGANMTRHARRAMTCAFMPDGATFNGRRNILPESYFSSLKVGDVLNNDEQNPLVWHKSWENRV